MIGVCIIKDLHMHTKITNIQHTYTHVYIYMHTCMHTYTISIVIIIKRCTNDIVIHEFGRTSIKKYHLQYSLTLFRTFSFDRLKQT